MERNKYFAPVPSLNHSQAFQYSQAQVAPSQLNRTAMSTDEEAIPLQQEATNYSQDQLDSIHKSLAQKKEFVDHEVHKSSSMFEKVNKFYQCFAKVKTVVLVLFSAYHFFTGTEDNDSVIVTFLLSLMMSLVVFAKHQNAKKALESKHHQTSKKLFKKTVISGFIFAVLFGFWALIVMDNMKTKSQVPRVDPEFVQRGMESFSQAPNVQIPDLKYIRVGAPAAHNKRHENNKFEMLKSKTALKLNRDKFDDFKRKNHHKHSKHSERQQEPVDHHQLQQDLSVVFIFTVLSVITVGKFSYFLIHFMRFTKALEKQEKVNMMVAHFKKTTPVALGRPEPAKAVEKKKPIEEEKEAPVANADIPIIEEETLNVPTKSTIAEDDTKIYEVPTSGMNMYPSISSLPKEMQGE